MNQSIINICNLALSNMGGNQLKTVNALSESTSEARACNRLYPQILSSLLRKHPFGFACVEAPLGLLQVYDNRHLPYEYAYPADALRIWSVGLEGGFHEYRLPVSSFTIGYGQAGRVIRTALDQAFAYYSRYVDDPNRFDALFTDAVVWALTSQLCMALANDARRAEMFAQRAAAAYEMATGADANESAFDVPEPYFITERY